VQSVLLLINLRLIHLLNPGQGHQPPHPQIIQNQGHESQHLIGPYHHYSQIKLTSTVTTESLLSRVLHISFKDREDDTATDYDQEEYYELVEAEFVDD
jgi:hypothetical protein